MLHVSVTPPHLRVPSKWNLYHNNFSSSHVVRCGGQKNSEGNGSRKATKRIAVLGGTGRVGGSTARGLTEYWKREKDGDDSSSVAAENNLEILICGRNQEKGEAVCTSIGKDVAHFEPCDLNEKERLRLILKDCDLVIHTAGPFQRAQEQGAVIEAALDTKTPYLDVCDDQDFSQRLRRGSDLAERAKREGVPCITSAGIYPGVSNLMAAELVRISKEGKGECESVGYQEEPVPTSLKFSYFTAGSGGAGPTILSTSFLLLGEEVLVFYQGKEMRVKAYSGERAVDFGKGVGKKSVYLLNLPEVLSCHQTFGIPTVSARFGTSPFIYNWIMQAMANLLPKEFLEDREKVAMLVRLADPIVRLTDEFSGEKIGMRVDLELNNGKKASSLYSHRKLSQCVGNATAAFALAMLEGGTQSGIWFPEEEEGISISARKKLLDRAAKGCTQFASNKAPWMLETPPTNLGFGLYWE